MSKNGKSAQKRRYKNPLKRCRLRKSTKNDKNEMKERNKNTQKSDQKIDKKEGQRKFLKMSMKYKK